MTRCAGHPYDEKMNLREQQAKQTYEKIFRTAWEMLRDGSFEKLSVDRLCTLAGISKGGFYHHFSSKDQLLSLMIGSRMGEMITERIEPCMGQKSAFELLEIYVNTLVEFHEKYPGNTLGRCWAAMVEHPEMTKDIQRMESYQILHKIVAQGIAEGSIRKDLDAAFCQSCLNGMINGIILHGTILGEGTQLAAFAKESMKLIFRALSE